jgi:hypothetical protein
MSKRHPATRRNPLDDGESMTESNEGLLDARFRRIKLVISAMLVFHLAAVVLPPLAFQTLGSDGPSPLIGTLIRPFAGYGQFLHMDRGYAFFAPNPGPSHLIQAAITGPDGAITERIYPDLDDQWPRLLYHRHFMLSEFLNEFYYPPLPPIEMFESDAEDAENWRRRRARYEFIRQSMVEHLKSVNAGREVALRRIEHGLPGLQDYREEPIELNDPRLYSVLLDRPIMTEELNPEASEEIPASGIIEDPKVLPLPEGGDARNGGTSAGGTSAGGAPGTVHPAADDAAKPETRS